MFRDGLLDGWSAFSYYSLLNMMRLVAYYCHDIRNPVKHFFKPETRQESEIETGENICDEYPTQVPQPPTNSPFLFSYWMNRLSHYDDVIIILMELHFSLSLLKALCAAVRYSHQLANKTRGLNILLAWLFRALAHVRINEITIVIIPLFLNKKLSARIYY